MNKIRPARCWAVVTPIYLLIAVKVISSMGHLGMCGQVASVGQWQVTNALVAIG
jgi:hypothetical protein